MHGGCCRHCRLAVEGWWDDETAGEMGKLEVRWLTAYSEHTEQDVVINTLPLPLPCFYAIIARRV
jgi:hypothetical protein